MKFFKIPINAKQLGKFMSTKNSSIRKPNFADTFIQKHLTPNPKAANKTWPMK